MSFFNQSLSQRTYSAATQGHKSSMATCSNSKHIQALVQPRPFHQRRNIPTAVSRAQWFRSQPPNCCIKPHFGKKLLVKPCRAKLSVVTIFPPQHSWQRVFLAWRKPLRLATIFSTKMNIYSDACYPHDSRDTVSSIRTVHTVAIGKLQEENRKTKHRERKMISEKCEKAIESKKPPTRWDCELVTP